MNVLLVHNEYGRPSGEEAVVARTHKLLREHSHEVTLYFRRSADILKMRFGHTRAFVSGIYSLSSANAVRRMLHVGHIDVAHIHNVFPLISPSILPVCQKAGVPVVMTVHNYRLICPSGLHFRGGQICEKCSNGREWWCIFRNCEGNLLKSLGYALRNYVARKRRAFLDNVTLYVCLTKFQQQWLIREGFPAERCVIVPNMVDSTGIKASEERGEFVGYVGRISPEKGLQTLIESARRCQNIGFRAAGSYTRMPHLRKEAPQNFEFCSHLNRDKLSEFYADCRIVVLCSIWYEGFPGVLVEAMNHGKPIIASRIGGIPEIVDDGVTGLLFKPGNTDDLEKKIRYLWDRPDLCRQMGQAGREKAVREYSPDKYYERLMAVYEKAIELGPGGLNRNS